MKLSLRSIMDELTVKKYEVKDKHGKIDKQKSRDVAIHTILMQQGM